MAPGRRLVLLVALVGLLLVLNPLWLFPHHGDTRYTYERSQITVTNGTLTYPGQELPGFAEWNDLNAVGCERWDEDLRACAFDHYLRTHDAVTVPRRGHDAHRIDYVRLRSGYYERTQHTEGVVNEGTRTYDVERVTPETVLAAIATDVSGSGSADLSEDVRLEFRLAVAGGSETAFDRLADDELGNVYERNGSYYTVVVTNSTAVDRLPSTAIRGWLMGAGVLLLFGVGLVLFDRVRGEADGRVRSPWNR